MIHLLREGTPRRVGVAIHREILTDDWTLYTQKMSWRVNVWIIRKSRDIKWPPRSWNFNKGHREHGQPISTAINDDEEKYFVPNLQWLRGTTMALDSCSKLPAIWVRAQNYVNSQWSHLIKMKLGQLLRTLLLINPPVKCFKEAGSSKEFITISSKETG